jgi:hypothetical protein
MNTSRSVPLARQLFAKIDWKLLLFLVLLLNVKLVVKLLAIVFIFLVQPNFRFRFNLKGSRLPLFYLAVIAFALFNALLYRDIFQLNYDLALLGGIGFWLASILCIHQLKLFVDKGDAEKIYRTLVLFFILNAGFSFGEVFRIIIETGHINPYRYQGEFQKYFISTGDYIKGISFDTSTTNAVISAFGVVLFLNRKNYPMVFLCIATLLLTCSNMTNVVLFAVLFFLFVFKTVAEQKSVIIACLALLIIFMTRVTPQNVDYVSASVEKLADVKKPATPVAQIIPLKDRPDSLLTPEQKKEKYALLKLDTLNLNLVKNRTVEEQPVVAHFAVMKETERIIVPQDSIHTPTFQHKDDTTAVRLNMFHFINNHHLDNTAFAASKLPGKIIALRQTYDFLKNDPLKIFTGAGMAKFSSKLAFRTTGLQVAGGYPAAYTYINEAFLQNHLGLFLYYFSKKDGLHSVIHSPNSVYDQLLGEYGIAGLGLFLVFYVGYFLKQYKKLTYGLPLLMLLMGVLFIDYWFEQLSVIIIFELLMLLDIKEQSTSTP